VARAAGEQLADAHPGGRVVVAHDTRFLGERLAREAASVLAGAGLRVTLVAGAVPTPVVAHAIRQRRAVAGLVLTASHNPPEYQGVKLLTGQGAAAPTELTQEVERRTQTWLRHAQPPRGSVARSVDVLEPYLRDVFPQLDGAAFRGSGLRVVYDALHGSGAGVLDELLRRLGVEVHVRRSAPDPCFGGVAPEPEPEQLTALARELRRGRGARLGLATDGDADRFAVVDTGGRILDASESLALLVDHLARTGRAHKAIALSSAVGSLPERVASWHGLGVERDAVGFKHLAPALEQGRVDLAGDESGGFVLRGFGYDKDGILAGGLVAELAATLRGPLRRRLAELQRRCGPCVWCRTAVPAGPRVAERLEGLESDPPQRIAGVAVRGIQTSDGLRLELADGFVQWRSSGTEPLVRIYAEAPDDPRLGRRLRAAARLLGVGWRQPARPR
jgi:phosphomannomutase